MSDAGRRPAGGMVAAVLIFLGTASPGSRIPPEPAAIFQGGLEPAKTRILQQVLNRDKAPQIL